MRNSDDGNEDIFLEIRSFFWSFERKMASKKEANKKTGYLTSAEVFDQVGMGDQVTTTFQSRQERGEMKTTIGD